MPHCVCRPGSFFEFHRCFAPLTAAGFDVVAPSLVGYGFSDEPVVPGFGLWSQAHTFDLLMRTLGYGRGYLCQGGDWGSIIGKTLCQLASLGQITSCKGGHFNMLIAPPPLHDTSTPESLRDSGSAR